MSPVSLRIFNFLEPPCGKAANTCSVKQNVINNVPKPNLAGLAPKPNTQALPEQFSEHWQNKLELELRARKFSQRTQSLYLYFNRLFCNTLQKTTQEIEPQDISTYSTLS